MTRTSNASNSILNKFLSPISAVKIVDIGANPIDGKPPYADLLNFGLASLIGFEPQEDALRKLREEAQPYEQYYPYAIGDGGKAQLNVYNNSGLTSLLTLDSSSIEVFKNFSPSSFLLQNVDIQTVRLDDIPEIERIDFLKIDIQGGELPVFKNARLKLVDTVCIQTEVSFVPLYKNQPCIGDIDLELRSQGFIPHCFAYPLDTRCISPAVLDSNEWLGLNQLVEADMVYVKDFRNPSLFSNEQLKKLALIAHYSHGSVDLAAHCLSLLATKGVIDKVAVGEYLASCAGVTHIRECNDATI